MTSSVFFTGMARIRRACSRHDGNRYSKNRKNVLIAANLEFRVLAQFPRSFSRCSRKASTSVASSCSIKSAEGVVFSRSRGEAHQQLECIGIRVRGLDAHFALAGKVFTQEYRQMRDRGVSSLTSSMQRLSGYGHVAQEFRCGLQIPVGIGHVSVTKIGTQRSHMPRNSLTVACTLFQ